MKENIDIINSPSFSGRHQKLPKKTSSPIRLEYKKEQLPTNTLLPIPFWHEEMEVKYFLKGGAVINCGSNCFLTEKDDLVIINPYEYHNTEIFEEGNNPVYHMMNINLSHPAVYTVFKDNKELFEGNEAKLPEIIPFFLNRLSNTDSLCVKLFTMLCDEYDRNGNEFTPLAENLLRSFLYSLINYAVNPDHPQNYKSLNSATVDIVPALQYIDSHFNEDINLNTLSDLCNLSVSRFSHLFKEVTGTSAIQYVNDLRVSKASMYLNTTTLSISAIAQKIGFDDAAYFSRIFRKITGISPSDYRKKQNN
ncbi:MAG: helix-turn-helix transcriptional regulator [Ruminococcaceae bacterium]|nr:helix-turn-helix transcriptional regulator [Oscillospiraceae bacterium]